LLTWSAFSWDSPPPDPGTDLCVRLTAVGEEEPKVASEGDDVEGAAEGEALKVKFMIGRMLNG
jgi:hypothetical protein